jgi:hypothetical protein
MAHLDKTGGFELLRKGRSVGRRELLENSDIGARERSEVLLDARHLCEKGKGLFSGAGGTIIKKLKKRGERGGRLDYVHVHVK